ncbi:PAS domain-containing sensor histidine kinase [Sulfurimicrobium lacus]|uniref:histidine kinase n=1 Tax=Sulfurimicrobium lacus TaxID=2715678 RepID=A0A6F8VGR5_9PROT|nr:ATP-binding protein [Sulfurimicrobium lacus]BCB28540.1 PAS domain-containing sensor histidine kinase [Sulfurimicrobium lacus]
MVEKHEKENEARQFMSSVMASMSDVLLVCSPAGRIEEVNRALVKLLRRSEDELRGSALADLLAEDSILPPIKGMPQTQGPICCMEDCEMLLRGADGSIIPVAMNCTPRYDQHGEEVGYVLVGRPIGELRRAYEALHDAHEELKLTQRRLLHSEKMVALGRLVAGVAHELNNPISFVLGNVHALQRYTQRLKTYLDAIHDGADLGAREEMRQKFRIDRILEDIEPLIDGTMEGAERTQSIVEGLKRFSARDAEQTERFDLVGLVAKVVHWVVGSGPEKLEVISHMPEHLPTVGNSGQIQQVVINLLQNALDATAGQVSRVLEISGSVQGKWAVVAFHDNGPGIDPKHQTQLFDPFFTTKPVGKGTGLGLSISYGLVARHGGELSVANHPAGGAVFTLKLPLDAFVE